MALMACGPHPAGESISHLGQEIKCIYNLSNVCMTEQPERTWSKIFCKISNQNKLADKNPPLPPSKQHLGGHQSASILKYLVTGIY